MDQLNVRKPSIEPRASGHIIEQIELIKKILAVGLAYESAGSIYFDVAKYNESHHYGILSGRVLEDMLSNTRVLEGQDCLLYTSPSPRDGLLSRMPSSA